MSNFVIDINQLNDLNGIFKKNDVSFNNKQLFIVFKGKVNQFKAIPKNKCFIEIDNKEYDLLKKLLLKIEKDLNLTILKDDFLYIKNNKFLISWYPGYFKDNNPIIFTNCYKLDTLKKLNLNEIPNKFNGFFTIKLKYICENSYNNIKLTLLTDLYEIMVDEKLEEIVPLSLKIVSNYKKM